MGVPRCAGIAVHPRDSVGCPNLLAVQPNRVGKHSVGRHLAIAD